MVMMMHGRQRGIDELHAVGEVPGLMMQCLIVAGQTGGDCVAGWRFDLVESRLVAPMVWMRIVPLHLLVQQQAAGVAAHQVRGVRVAGRMDLGTYVLICNKQRTEFVS